MYDILQTFLLGLMIGFTGALAPGPTLVATINASISGDWKIGPKVVMGHMIAESVLFLLIVLGLATLALPYTSAIAVIGGIALIAFGALTITGSRGASLNGPVTGTVSNPFVAGLVTSAANPYFLDLVAHDWQCHGDSRACGWNCPCSSLHGRALVCGSRVVHAGIHRSIPWKNHPVRHVISQDHGCVRGISYPVRGLLPLDPLGSVIRS